MKITVGHTPDADDAFMFYGMLSGHIPDAGFEIEHKVQDIESLNRMACSPQLDVTAVSVHACAYAPAYAILRSGGSFGLGYGPIVTARTELTASELQASKIAVPGKMTSAFLLLQLALGSFEYTEMKFSDIPKAVRDGTADAGLVIHETQLSHNQEGNLKVMDLGEWWSEKTGGLPTPLGINVMRSGIGDDIISRFDRYLHDSIVYGLEHFDDALKHAMAYGRGKSQDLIAKFVRMYVNEKTVDMSDAGEESIRTLFGMAKNAGIVPDFNLRFAQPLAL